MKVVTFKIEEDLLEKLDEYAELTGESRSEVIRRALELLLFGSNSSGEKAKSITKKKVKVYTS